MRRLSKVIRDETWGVLSSCVDRTRLEGVPIPACPGRGRVTAISQYLGAVKHAFGLKFSNPDLDPRSQQADSCKRRAMGCQESKNQGTSWKPVSLKAQSP